jgi:hypothetical protein
MRGLLILTTRIEDEEDEEGITKAWTSSPGGDR